MPARQSFMPEETQPLGAVAKPRTRSLSPRRGILVAEFLKARWS